MALVVQTVPDIGDYSQIPVIDIAVKPGDRVAVDDTLITLESDKATMDVPATAAGVVRSIKLKLGDKVSQGDVILELEASSAVAEAAPAAPATASAPALAPTPTPTPVPTPVAKPAVAADRHVALVVIGAGPGGYSAAFRAADLGLETVLVEKHPTLGGVCLNVGCIPSKALLHTTGVMREALSLAEQGVHFGAPRVDLEQLRLSKEAVVGKLTGGLAFMAKARRVEVIQGTAQLASSHHMTITRADGSRLSLSFDQLIVATGSRAVKLPFIPEDPRVWDATAALQLRQIPKRLLVIGGGIIGLEMGTVYASLGSEVDVVELGSDLMPGADRDVVKVWEKTNARLFAQLKTQTQVKAVELNKKHLKVSLSHAEGNTESPYDAVLVAAGRVPNGKTLGLENAGVVVNAQGFIPTDETMRTNVAHIFAIGDARSQPMLAHKAVHEAHVAAEVASGHKAAWVAQVIPSVAYTDPEIAWVGVTETEARASGRKLGKSVFPWSASGRALANHRSEGMTKLLFDPESGRIVGGAIVGTQAGDLIAEVALAIEMGADAHDIGRTIHPHPTLSESVGMAAEIFTGSCTDVPPQKR